jgi:hypothetical protein
VCRSATEDGRSDHKAAAVSDGEAAIPVTGKAPRMPTLYLSFHLPQLVDTSRPGQLRIKVVPRHRTVSTHYTRFSKKNGRVWNGNNRLVRHKRGKVVSAGFHHSNSSFTHLNPRSGSRLIVWLSLAPLHAFDNVYGQRKAQYVLWS